MASEYNGKSSGTTAPKVRKYYDEIGDEKDWDFKFDDLEIGTQEAESRVSTSGNDARRLDPVTDLKHRLSMWDPNLPVNDHTEEMPKVVRQSKFLETSLIDDVEVFTEKEEEEDSPYPEVRAAVHNYDEDLPCNTIRAWTLGRMYGPYLFQSMYQGFSEPRSKDISRPPDVVEFSSDPDVVGLVFIGASVNTLFSLRAPSIGLGALIAQIIAWPLGHGWAKVMPTRKYNTFGLKWSLNPGPFNIKEHTIIVVMASVSFSAAYATDIILAQIAFYKQDFGLLFQLMLTISTQSVGYGIAGVMRKYLVYPAAMIWPGNLVSVTLMNAMYEKAAPNDPSVLGGNMPRYRWFAYVCLGAFVYYFIPGFLMQFLSVFAVATWIAPNNVVVNQLFGGTTGLSLLPISFDWTQISGFVGSPLIPPWFAIANTMIGVVVFYIFGASILHYTGTWSARYLPMSDSVTYDNTGVSYNVTKILTPEFTLDIEAYKSYSPLFLSTTFALSYGLSFAAIASLIVYTYLHHGEQIWRQFRNSTNEEPDIHMKMMSKYKEAPTWWYLILFVLMVALSLVTVLAFPTNLTWWAFLLALGISFVFALPIGIIQAITNTQIGLNVLTEFVFGYIQPGRPLALMIFKTYGYITMAQALGFVSDLKFGHYMKIPPRTMFMAQVVATTLSCFIQIAVLNFALKNIDGICTPHQPQHFTCPGGRVFFSASVIWGLIGPGRIFSPGQIYSGLFWFFLIGAALPVIFYFGARKFPKSPIKYLMAPLLLGGASGIPPASPLNYLSWGIVGFIFQHLIRKRYFGWWSRLNYLTSAGLDLGLALSTLFIFFAFTLNGVEAPAWWGNTVTTTTMDAMDTAVQATVGPGEYFGPVVW